MLLADEQLPEQPILPAGDGDPLDTWRPAAVRGEPREQPRRMHQPPDNSPRGEKAHRSR
jgi:hypothetical protein